MKAAIALLVVTALAACHIPDLSHLDLSGCIADCQTTLDASCGAKESECLATTQTCFDAAADCADACLTCKQAGACDGDVCNNGCAHQARACADSIRPCLESEKKMLVSECIDPLLACVSQCVADAEAQLRGRP